MTTLAELRDAAIADTHRNYDAPTMARFVAQAEGLIRSMLEAYSLTATLTDVDRPLGVTSGVYTLPIRTVLVRYVHNADSMPLDQVDENLAWSHRSASIVGMYAVRATSILVAGVPGAGTSLELQYLGMPAALTLDADTNQLLNDFPQLYVSALGVYMHNRAQDYESASLCRQEVVSLIRSINRSMHKLLGGARAVPVYNTNFRSTY